MRSNRWLAGLAGCAFVALAITAIPSGARAGHIDGEVRAGLYPDHDAGMVGGGLLTMSVMATGTSIPISSSRWATITT